MSITGKPNLMEVIICSAFEVHNTLGSGFLEQVYENALQVELQSHGIRTEAQKPVAVRYKDKVVGEFVAALVVEDVVILEITSAEKLCDAHENRLKNCLKAAGIEMGLLINFGKSVEVRRKSVTPGVEVIAP